MIFICAILYLLVGCWFFWQMKRAENNVYSCEKTKIFGLKTYFAVIALWPILFLMYLIYLIGIGIELFFDNYKSKKG